MKKKKQQAAFTSFRIIGEKAQKILARARDTVAQAKMRNGANGAGHSPMEEAENVEITVHVSSRSVLSATLTILAVAFVAVFLWSLQDVLILLFLSIFIAVLIDPGVQQLKRLGIPRGLGILFHYFVALALFLFLVFSLIPIVAEQLQSLAVTMTQQVNAFLAEPRIWIPFMSDTTNGQLSLFVQNTLQAMSIDDFAGALREMGQNLSTAAQGSLSFAVYLAGSVLNFFFNLIIVLVLAFFLQLEKEEILGWLRGFLPWKYRSYVDDKSEAISWKLAQWVRGQLILCVAIGILTFLALVILRMPYALTLALLAGFTEFIPYVGPFMAAVPAILIGIAQNGFIWGVVVFVVYYVIQWCENNLLVPLIMKRTVGLSPTATIIAMLVAVSFPTIIHPILGIILSIPLTTVLGIFLEDWRSHRSTRSKMMTA
jgi:predicted PurR-regulated permease PerM